MTTKVSFDLIQPAGAGSEIPTVYNTVQAMIDGGVDAGSLARTKGYYTAGDGGGAEYLITAGNTGDGFGDHDIGANTATLQIIDMPTALQVGCVPDSVFATDNTPRINVTLEKT